MFSVDLDRPDTRDASSDPIGSNGQLTPRRHVVAEPDGDLLHVARYLKTVAAAEAATLLQGAKQTSQLNGAAQPSQES